MGLAGALHLELKGPTDYCRKGLLTKVLLPCLDSTSLQFTNKKSNHTKKNLKERTTGKEKKAKVLTSPDVQPPD